MNDETAEQPNNAQGVQPPDAPLACDYAFILRDLARAGGVHAMQHAPKHATTAQLATLAKRGLIEILPGSEALGRVMAQVTPAGKAALERSGHLFAPAGLFTVIDGGRKE